jgi:hypothetical protein
LSATQIGGKPVSLGRVVTAQIEEYQGGRRHDFLVYKFEKRYENKMRRMVGELMSSDEPPARK